MLIISAKGVVDLAGINCGRKARKKINNFGFRMLIRRPSMQIRLKFFCFLICFILSLPLSRHISQARQNRYAVPANWNIWKVCILICKTVVMPMILANTRGNIPRVHQVQLRHWLIYL